jgi:hypothetical protein
MCIKGAKADGKEKLARCIRGLYVFLVQMCPQVQKLLSASCGT